MIDVANSKPDHSSATENYDGAFMQKYHVNLRYPDQSVRMIVESCGVRTNGHIYWAYVLVALSDVDAFMAVRARGRYKLNDYGHILAYGDDEDGPPSEMVEFMREQFGCHRQYEGSWRCRFWMIWIRLRYRLPRAGWVWMTKKLPVVAKSARAGVLWTKNRNRRKEVVSISPESEVIPLLAADESEDSF